MKRFSFRAPGSSIAVDVWASNEKHARAEIRAMFGRRNLRGFDVWSHNA